MEFQAINEQIMNLANCDSFPTECKILKKALEQTLNNLQNLEIVYNKIQSTIKLKAQAYKDRI
jgi:hypothetical protein